MKSSIHLFYGIIIGILLVACTCLVVLQTSQFEYEEIFPITLDSSGVYQYDSKLLDFTIIDWEIAPDGRHYLHTGR